MASFMRRFAQTQGSAGVSVTDASDTVPTNGTAYVELLTLATAPKAEANVTLNGHVTLAKPTDMEGSYQVIVARDSCTGTVVGAGWPVQHRTTRIRHRRGDGIGCRHRSDDLRPVRCGDGGRLAGCNRRATWAHCLLGPRCLS